jgi:tetratricopeptide (TPR) repeat protein
MLGRVPFQRDLRRQLEAELTTAKRVQLAEQLHGLADDVRVAYGAEALPPARARALAAQCEALWQQRRAIAAALDVTPAVRADLQDIAIFAAHLSPPSDAARLLSEAEVDFGPSAILQHEQRRRGLAPTGVPMTSPAVNSASEHYSLGRALLSAGDVPRAAEELAAAVAADPGGLWPNFYAGLCFQRMGRHDDAVAAFSVCIGGAPDVAGCYYNRALSYAALGRTDRAMQDYDKTLALDPAHVASLLNRGALHFQLGHAAPAVADLELSLKHGADPTTVHYDLAVIHASLDDRARALEHARRALLVNPTHGPAAQLRDTLAGDRATAKAGTVR